MLEVTLHDTWPYYTCWAEAMGDRILGIGWARAATRGVKVFFVFGVDLLIFDVSLLPFFLGVKDISSSEEESDVE